MRLKEVQVQEDPNENVNEQGQAHPSRRDTGTHPDARPGVGACQKAPGGRTYANGARPRAEQRSNAWLMELGWTLLD